MGSEDLFWQLIHPTFFVLDDFHVLSGLTSDSTWWDGASVLEPSQADCTAVGQDLAVCGVQEGVPVEGAVAAG